MTRRNAMTLPVHLRPKETLYARVDPTGLVDGELKIDTDGVVWVSAGVTDAATVVGVLNYIPEATFHELVSLPGINY